MTANFLYKVSIEYDKHKYDDYQHKLLVLIAEWLTRVVGKPHIVGYTVEGEWLTELSYPRAHTISTDYFFKNESDAILFAVNWLGAK